MDVEFDHESTVSHMDRWTNYLVELQATPLLLIARTDDGQLVTCSPEGLQELPFAEAMGLLAGWDSAAVDKI